jgi:flavodoxin
VAVSIVYYSHTGNNQLLAESLAHRLRCGAFRIVERHRRTPLRIVVDLVFGLSPALQPFHAPLEAYSHVILVGPVWASRLASPLRTFLAQHGERLGDYSFITLCGYERAAQKQRLTEELTRRVGHPPRAVCELRVADLVPARNRNAIRVVTPYRVAEEEISLFDGAIREFSTAAGV